MAHIDLTRKARFWQPLGVGFHPEDAARAVPVLLPLLNEETAYIRGEAASLLMTINTPEARDILKDLQDDVDPQVREMVRDFFQEN